MGIPNIVKMGYLEVYTHLLPPNRKEERKIEKNLVSLHWLQRRPTPSNIQGRLLGYERKMHAHPTPREKQIELTMQNKINRLH